MPDLIEQQIAFIVEIDKLKHICRKTKPIGSDRYENDAEHTWHLAMMAVVLAGYANGPELDLLKTLKMLLIHDIVEIDAGDTFVYDEKGYEDKAEREEKAAVRLFGLLPAEQRDEFLALWREFEARETAESRFAAAIDRMQPMLLNAHNGGQSWNENNITADRVFARNRHVAEGSEALWSYMEKLLGEAVGKGYLKSGENPR